MLNDIKHIILTGKNGSGKTTILKSIASQIAFSKTSNSRDEHINGLLATIKSHPFHSAVPEWNRQITELSGVNLFFIGDNTILKSTDKYIFSFFKAHRRVELLDVRTVSKETEFTELLRQQTNPEDFAKQFKQYLVNKKVYEAFDYMNSKDASINHSKIFFSNLTITLQKIFGDPELKFEFIQESFEFFIELGDGRKITFNQLSEGFSAFITILMDLLMRVDLIRKSLGDYNYNPPGFVLIDEPETHFHLEMQYEILPLLTELFPAIQFIVATHSPAVISSIKNAVIYDLSSKEELSERQAGSSYSELMINHFGLDNEFSPVADKILEEVSEAVKNNDAEKLTEIIVQNEPYLTPSLKFEIENHIIIINSTKAKI